MMKYKLILILIGVGLIIFGSWYISYLRGEKQRIEGNYDALIERENVLKEGIRYEKTRNDELMVKVSSLELTNREIRETQTEMTDNLRNMRIALRKVESYSATNTQTTYNIETTLKDSVIRDTIPVEYIAYHSKWLDLDGYKISDKFNLSIETRDSLVQVVYWEKINGFWFIRWNKRYSQKITSANPHSKITYSEFIVPKKK